MAPAPVDRPNEDDYRKLLAFRTGLRRFLRWSEQQAAAAGVTAAHHQLMLAIRGHDDPRGPTIGEIADALLLRHHSAVGLVDRAVEQGLVERVTDADDHRVVRLRLTRAGQATIRRLSDAHIEELRRLAPRMQSLWADLDGQRASTGGR